MDHLHWQFLAKTSATSASYFPHPFLPWPPWGATTLIITTLRIKAYLWHWEYMTIGINDTPYVLCHYAVSFCWMSLGRVSLHHLGWRDTDRMVSNGVSPGVATASTIRSVARVFAQKRRQCKWRLQRSVLPTFSTTIRTDFFKDFRARVAPARCSRTGP